MWWGSGGSKDAPRSSSSGGSSGAAASEHVVAVAVDADKSSQHALKWTADHLLVRKQAFFLLHVRRKMTSVANSSGDQLSLDGFDDDVQSTFIEDLDFRTKEILLPFQCFCSRRGLQCREIILDDMQVSKAIINFIVNQNVDRLILGASSRNALTRTFKSADVPTSVSKLAPEFCSVYVISKGKISSIRPATQPHTRPVSKSIAELPGSQFKSIKSEPDARHFSDHPSRSPLNRFAKGDNLGHSFYSTASCPSPTRSSVENPPYPQNLVNGKYSGEQNWSIGSGSSTQSPKIASKEHSLSNQSVEGASTDGETEAASEMSEMQRRRPKLLREEPSPIVPKKKEQEAPTRLVVPEDCFSSGIRYRRYSVEEIQKATEDFSVALKIGEGGYGPVYKSSLDHTLVAIKVLKSDAIHGLKQFQQEIEVLSSIRHPNMVLLLGACPEFGCLVYEFMANGSLEDRLFCLHNSPPLTWQMRFRIAAEIATGLLFLHQTKPEPLVHRDLKPGNILLDQNYVSKIADVGLARLIPEAKPGSNSTQYHMTAAAGTFCYIDPEYQKTGMLGIKSDIYAFGIILLQLITGLPAMGLADSMEKAMDKGKVTDKLDPKVQDWPMEEAVKFVKLALKCSELRRRDRPDLSLVILPELNKMRALANSKTEDPWVHRFDVSKSYKESIRKNDSGIYNGGPVPGSSFT